MLLSKVLRRVRGRVLWQARTFAAAPSPWVRPLGEGALLLRFGNDISNDINRNVLNHMRSLEKNRGNIHGVKEILPAFASLLVHYDPLEVTSAQIEEWCFSVSSGDDTETGNARTVHIPVCYGGEYGPDLTAAAEIAGLSAEDVVRLHSKATYQVYFLGFTGGFPYLGGLPEELACVPRLSTPRQRVERGAIGIAAGQTGVYTLTSPGGWYLLGQTPKALFDPSQDPPALLKPGDSVKFVPLTDATEFEPETVLPEENLLLEHPWIEIVSPGPMTSVQDVGREGYARHGVSKSGAADDLALRTGNALLGNPDDVAGLEVAMGKLKIRALGSSTIALTGADCGAKLTRSMFRGAPAESVCTNKIVSLQKGDELELGVARDGARAYLCVRGGVDVPRVLGSRSTDIKAKLGGHQGRILQVGDELGRCQYAGDASSVDLRAPYDPLREEDLAVDKREWVLRVLPGPGDPGTDTASAAICTADLDALVGAGSFDVTPRSDRMAVCVSHSGVDAGQRDLPVGGQQMSEACVSGTIQLPPDGNPVILLSEHQTTGGYKVPAVVIQADLWKVGQMRPGDKMRFKETTLEAATEALREVRSQAELTEFAQGDSASSRKDGVDPGMTVPPPSLYVLGNDDEEYWDAVLDYTIGNMGLPPAHRFALVPRSGIALKQIDLNADCGEGFDDAGLMKWVTSANISCGGHAGTTESIARTVTLALEHRVAIGAHVSFVDHKGFGRQSLNTPALELRDQVLWQTGALQGLCKGVGAKVAYIKPHGALYHAVMSGSEQGEAVHEAARMLELPLLLMPKSAWATFGEGFAERRYDGDMLRSRDQEGAVIHDPQEALQQALELAVRPNLHSICVHGDSPNAVEVAKTVRAGLEMEGYALGPFVH